MHTYQDQTTLNKINRIALAAADIILSHYAQTNRAIEIKLDQSPVTAADKAANEYIVKELQILFPDIPVVAEESPLPEWPIRKNWQLFWLVDPLDGTKEYITRNGQFTVNIALIYNQLPILGVVYAPVLRELFCGTAILGSFRQQIPTGTSHSIEENLNLTRIEAKPPEKGQPIIIIASRSHLNPETEAYIASLKQSFEANQTYEILNVGSSLKFCRLAQGQAHVYPRLSPTMEWDTAAGHAIAIFAGAYLFSHPNRTQPFVYNKLNLTNGDFVVSVLQI